MKKIALLLLPFMIAATVFAHEYLLLAAKFRVKKGDNIELHLFVADGFNIQQERGFQKAATIKFELLNQDSIIDLAGQENGSFPILNKKVNFTGGGLFHMERNYARISLTTARFLAYLKEDHIDHISPLVNLGKPDQKERYTRYIKCLVQSENTYSDTLYKTNTGQAFEIILLQNPYRLHAGAPIKATVLFQGKPFTGKLITARNRTGSEPAKTITAVTDKNGTCSFVLSRKGEWFIHATHMIRCVDKTDSDWESFWTSYSFEID